MSEINKLRQRLKNINKNVTEYRMTVSEAKALISEIDELLKPDIEPAKEAIVAPTVITRILDGGTF
jgi:predicted transcriptional regulator